MCFHHDLFSCDLIYISLSSVLDFHSQVVSTSLASHTFSPTLTADVINPQTKHRTTASSLHYTLGVAEDFPGDMTGTAAQTYGRRRKSCCSKSTCNGARELF